MYVNVTHSLANEMREVVEQEMARTGGTYVAGLVAMDVVTRLREENPELLAKFLDHHAVQVVREMIVSIDRAVRTRARVLSSTQTKSVFADALERHEAGDERALAPWLDTVYVITTENQRKRLHDMDKDDLEFAAAQYRVRAQTNAAQAAFLQALAAKVGARTVGEVFSDKELAQMWHSLA